MAKDITIYDCYRLTCYGFPESADVDKFLKSKAGKCFEIPLAKRDNTGFYIILKQPITNRYSKVQPRTSVEKRYAKMPNAGNEAYLTQNTRCRNIRILWTCNVWEHHATTEQAVNKYLESIRGKYIHLESVVPFRDGWLIRTIAKNSYGYGKYKQFIDLTRDEFSEYMKVRNPWYYEKHYKD